MANVRITEGFEEDLGMVLSDRVLNDILNTVTMLQTIPTMGSLDVPAAIALEFGKGVHKIPVNPFDIVTTYDELTDTVTVHGLIHQRAAW